MIPADTSREGQTARVVGVRVQVPVVEVELVVVGLEVERVALPFFAFSHLETPER